MDAEPTSERSSTDETSPRCEPVVDGHEDAAEDDAVDGVPQRDGMAKFGNGGDAGDPTAPSHRGMTSAASTSQVTTPSRGPRRRFSRAIRPRAR